MGKAYELLFAVVWLRKLLRVILVTQYCNSFYNESGRRVPSMFAMLKKNRIVIGFCSSA